MKRIFLIILITPMMSNAQEDYSKVLKSVNKIFDKGYAEVNTQDNYPWLQEDNEVLFDESTTLKGDTTGSHANGEYLMFRSPIPTGEILALTRKAPVSNSEWKEFQEWVIDSLARVELFIVGGWEEYIIREDKNGSLYNLPWGEGLINWKQQIDWTDCEKWEDLRILLYPPFEEFYRMNEIDGRRLNYLHYDPYMITSENEGFPTKIVANIAVDSSAWAATAEYFYDIPVGLANHYNSHNIFKDWPITGILATQAKAYCNWLQGNMQNELDKKKIPLEVIVTLPTLEQANQTKSPVIEDMFFPKRQMIYDWTITNAEYHEFLIYVRDSVIRQMLAEVSDDNYSIQSNRCGEEYHDLQIDWSKNVDYNDPVVNDLVASLYSFVMGNAEGIEAFPYWNYVYQYYWIDQIDASKLGGSLGKVLEEWTSNDFICESWACKDLDLSWTTIHGHNSGVRSHADRSQFIIIEQVSIYPGVDQCYWNKLELMENPDLEWCDTCCGFDLDETMFAEVPFEPYNFEADPEAQITEISYEQALAYYHWRLRSNPPAKDENPIVASLFPTEEQWELIKGGKEFISIQDRTIPFPTPTFRYTLHFYPKQ